MGRIKSALEIALEKTDAMEIDHEKIKHNSDIDKIRRIAGAYISGDDESEESLREKLSAFPSSLQREAIKTTVLNSIVLSDDESGLEDKTKKIASLISIVFPNDEILSYYREISQHLAQYPKHKEELLERLKEQLEPMLREKEEALRAKYGQSVHLSIEDDKDSLETINEYMKKLSNQYSDTLENAKAEMKRMLETF